MDSIFNRNPNAYNIDKNVRRVEPRHTPTVFNALFNHSNFWDGRAHNLFNGVSVIGPLDPNAKIWVVAPNGRLVQQTVRIPNSSLASQAVGPPTSNLEMSFFNRPFPMVGRKLLGLTPLGLQVVHPNDSVLGSRSNFPKRGLNTKYATLVRAAFQDRYTSDQLTPGGSGFTQIEANFTLFWGLAIQLYEFALISDQSPFDTFMEGNDAALSQEQLQGLLVFLNQGARGNPPEVDAAIAQAQGALGVQIGAGNCVSCHGSAVFTDAAFPALEEAPSELELIEIEDTAKLVDGFLALDTTVQALLDNGFSNIGVRPTADDLGRGGTQNGFPASFTRQMLFNPELLDGVIEKQDLPCSPGKTCPNRVMVDGAFKIPTLRNVEITGPYFHNGGQATLSQVVEFYDRQSDFGDVNAEFLDRNSTVLKTSRTSGLWSCAAGTHRQPPRDESCESKRECGDGVRHVPLHRSEPRAGGSLWVGQAF